MLHRTIQLDASKAVEAYEKRAKSYMQTGDSLSAIDDFGKVIELVPDSGKAHYNRGVAYLVAGKAGRAVADLTKAISLVTENVDSCYMVRSLAYFAQEEYDKAIADLTEVIRLDPLNEEAHYRRGLAYGNNGEFERAIADFSETIRLAPKHAGAYCNRALACMKGASKGAGKGAIVMWSGSYFNQEFLGVPPEDLRKRVIEDLTKAVGLQPGYAKALALRAIATLFVERNQSQQDWERAAELDDKYKKLTEVVVSHFE